MADLTQLSPQIIKQMTDAELTALAGEIRTLLIRTVSHNGGHLASNLGVVELTLALHRVFDSPVDEIIWDVGHQCYTHKIVTGRGGRFDTLRQKGGLSGFPKPEESEHDIFIAGHSSTSVSVAYGLAKAKTVQGEPGSVVCVIGDGSISGGMAFEALNHSGRSAEPLIVVLNDNAMSIDRSVGAMAKYLTRLRNGEQYFRFKARFDRLVSSIPGIGGGLRRVFVAVKDKLRDLFLDDTIFQKMGFKYLGPCDGHNLTDLTRLLRRAKEMHRPVLVHVQTIKGKGYPYAEHQPDTFHGLPSFDIMTGEREAGGKPTFSSVFGQTLADWCGEDDKLRAVTAAMTIGTGLEALPAERVIDVGMAEEHAATFSAGLWRGGLRPVLAVYSSFLQRAYDQINHDICLPRAHVVLAIDRAGVVGEDGETHQGLFDVSFLGALPHMTVDSPSNFAQLRACLKRALYETDGPAAVRYPRGGEPPEEAPDFATPEYRLFGRGGATLLVTYGVLTTQLLEARRRLREAGIGADVLQLIRIQPLPAEAIDRAAAGREIFFFEEGMRTGGVGERLAAALLERGFSGRYRLRAVEGQYVRQSTCEEALHDLGLDADGVTAAVLEARDDAT